MRIFKILKKIIFVFIILGLIGYLGIKIYVKMSPNVLINTANSVFLYDKDENVFFQGNDEK